METEDNAGNGLPDELTLLKRRADLMGVPYSNNIGIQTLRERINEKLGTTTEPVEQVSDEPSDEEFQDAEPNGFEAAQAVFDANTKTTEQILTAPLQSTETRVAAPEVGAAAIEAYLATLGLTPALLAKAAELASAPAQPVGSAPVQTISTKAKKGSLRKLLFDKHMKLVRIRATCMNPQKKDLQGEFFTVANKHLGTITKFFPFGEASENGYHVPEVIYKAMQRRKYVQISTYRDKVTKLERQKKTLVKEYAIEVLPPLSADELKKLAAAQLASGSTTGE